MRTPQFTDEQILAGLRAAAHDLGEPLRAAAYDSWQRGRTAASTALIVRRFGSWKAACDRAQVQANATRSTSRRWSDEEVVAIVARYLRAEEGTGSFADYCEWAKANAGAPSGATLRQRFAWAAVKQRALDAGSAGEGPPG